MRLEQGSLLVSHPAHADRDSVIVITDSGHSHTIGLELANPSEHTMAELMISKGIEWPWHTPVSVGGDHNRGALVMLHTDDWSSTNTNCIASNLCISSDALMIEKLEMNNTPGWYRLFLGCVMFSTQDLQRELSKTRSRWMLLPSPGSSQLERPATKIWQSCVDELTLRATQQYLV